MLDWIINNSEYIGFGLGFIFIFLEIKESIWLWPVGILAALFSIIVLYNAKVYADMGLQFYYFIISIYGWVLWFIGKKNGNVKKELPVIKTSKKQLFWLVLASLVIYAIIYSVLVKYTDSPIPGWDSLTTSLSIVATWMLTQKLIEQWWIWVFVNAITVVLYIYRGINLFALLYAIYSLMAIVGYLQWRKSMLKETVNA